MHDDILRDKPPDVLHPVALDENSISGAGSLLDMRGVMAGEPPTNAKNLFQAMMDPFMMSMAGAAAVNPFTPIVAQQLQMSMMQNQGKDASGGEARSNMLASSMNLVNQMNLPMLSLVSPLAAMRSLMCGQKTEQLCSDEGGMSEGVPSPSGVSAPWFSGNLSDSTEFTKEEESQTPQTPVSLTMPMLPFPFGFPFIPCIPDMAMAVGKPGSPLRKKKKKRRSEPYCNATKSEDFMDRNNKKNAADMYIPVCYPSVTPRSAQGLGSPPDKHYFADGSFGSQLKTLLSSTRGWTRLSRLVPRPPGLSWKDDTGGWNALRAQLKEFPASLYGFIGAYERGVATILPSWIINPENGHEMKCNAALLLRYHRGSCLTFRVSDSSWIAGETDHIDLPQDCEDLKRPLQFSTRHYGDFLPTFLVALLASEDRFRRIQQHLQKQSGRQSVSKTNDSMDFCSSLMQSPQRQQMPQSLLGGQGRRGGSSAEGQRHSSNSPSVQSAAEGEGPIAVVMAVEDVAFNSAAIDSGEVSDAHGLGAADGLIPFASDAGVLAVLPGDGDTMGLGLAFDSSSCFVHTGHDDGLSPQSLLGIDCGVDQLFHSDNITHLSHMGSIKTQDDDSSPCNHFGLSSTEVYAGSFNLHHLEGDSTSKSFGIPDIKAED